jgi:hypothetical protein
VVAFLYQQECFFFGKMCKYKTKTSTLQNIYMLSAFREKFVLPHIMQHSILNMTVKFYGSMHNILG